ncbi:molybdopterin cofactor-binding domain-containing protein [Mesorhizobium sp. SEMIA 3007]|uniref:molybdopterin cofactor-binding domain-containing protein n=1 Tax=Mesorhizobium sp. SEMIA 3007 TaxID=1862350 RepID=UPI000AC7C717|nr:molybdopterin cofactor-binding domain-containing protein [Mesorhizobium sp. SEMIA 3007]
MRQSAAGTCYTGMATITEVAVDTASGDVKLLSHHSILECGTQIVPELVSGQLQGGLAMGVGHYREARRWANAAAQVTAQSAPRRLRPRIEAAVSSSSVANSSPARPRSENLIPSTP